MNTEIYHPAGIRAHHISRALGGGPSEEKGQLEQDPGHVSLWLLRKAASNPEDISSHSSLFRKAEKFHISWPHYLDYYPGSSLRTQRLAGILNRAVMRKSWNQEMSK